MDTCNGGYLVVYEGGEGEIVEKKSRFIATVQPVESEEEAVSFINEMKKKYWDARHNCSAFVIGKHQEMTRCSDDGEPAQTAGRPMLDVLLKEGITNAAVVVTRYFGGVLLGTGGLVRAYQAAVRAGLEASRIVEKCPGSRLLIHTDSVIITVIVPEDKKEFIYKKIVEQTNGAAELAWDGDMVYARVDQELILFE